MAIQLTSKYRHLHSFILKKWVLRVAGEVEGEAKMLLNTPNTPKLNIQQLESSLLERTKISKYLKIEQIKSKEWSCYVGAFTILTIKKSKSLPTTPQFSIF